VTKLRELCLDIAYIPGPRYKVADGLSRTLFMDPDSEMDAVAEAVRLL